jgi:hypothetical protein
MEFLARKERKEDAEERKEFSSHKSLRHFASSLRALRPNFTAQRQRIVTAGNR